MKGEMGKRERTGASLFFVLSPFLFFLFSSFTSRRRVWLVVCAAALVAVSLSPSVSGKTSKGLSAKQARDLILRVPGIQLNKSALNVREVSTEGDAAQASAGVRTAFRFRKGAEGRWVAVEVRTGDRQWEELDLIARALKAEGDAPFVADLEALAAEMAARAAKAAEGEKRAEPTVRKPEAARAEQQAQSAQSEEQKEPRRGALTAKLFSALLASATLETEVETAFRFTRAGGRWRVDSLRVGEGAWQSVDAIASALNAEKNARARAELQTLRAALEAFRRERGFYVVAEDETVLVDHLSPRYLQRIIRFDPWHRPYRYKGTRDAYTLASDGADGKQATADDVTPDRP